MINNKNNQGKKNISGASREEASQKTCHSFPSSTTGEFA